MIENTADLCSDTTMSKNNFDVSLGTLSTNHLLLRFEEKLSLLISISERKKSS